MVDINKLKMVDFSLKWHIRFQKREEEKFQRLMTIEERSYFG